MVNVHKRNKRTRLRGSRSAGSGFRKKDKSGKGNTGGKGWSGTGKRASQKQQKALMYAHSLGFEKYFGSRGLTSAPTAKRKTNQLNLDDIKANFFEKDGMKIDLRDYKILGDGEGFNAEIIAKGATKSAIEKMESTGGKIIISEEKSEKKTTTNGVSKSASKNSIEVKSDNLKKKKVKK